MKKCTICKYEKDESQFNKKKSVKCGLQPACKECSHKHFRTYYTNNREKQKAQVLKRKAIYKKELWNWMCNYLKKHPCIDCNESDILVLDFDHLRDKINNISTMVGSNNCIETIQKEIDKCVVRCRNCHSRKTHKEQNTYKYKFLLGL